MQVLGCLLMAVYGVAQIWAAVLGLDDLVGQFFSIVVVIMCLFFRFSLPVTIASFFGAMNGWGWHWLFALLFAAPGLLLMIPAVLASVVEASRKTIRPS